MDIEKTFNRYAQKIDKVVNKQLKKTGEEILIDSQMLAPIDTGLMVNSTEVAVKDNRVEVRYNIDYSLYVHEDLTMNHPNGGQAKFLELATLENAKNHFGTLKKLIGDIQ
jgi:hypothetical protein